MPPPLPEAPPPIGGGEHQYPLQARGPLLPPPAVSLQEPGGTALLRGAAEPGLVVGGNPSVQVTGAPCTMLKPTRAQRGSRPTDPPLLTP